MTRTFFFVTVDDHHFVFVMPKAINRAGGNVWASETNSQTPCLCKISQVGKGAGVGSSWCEYLA